jgi:hypothetical protein
VQQYRLAPPDDRELSPHPQGPVHGSHPPPGCVPFRLPILHPFHKPAFEIIFYQGLH